MKRKQLKFGKGFRIAIDGAKAQAAEMVIAPGNSEGGPKNRHRGADQWLFVVSGRGCARVNGRRYALSAGSLLLIERADQHEITAMGRAPLRTLNVYVPRAYTRSGDELPAAKR
jgi:mannose-6-phosphate isomerase-like protein (cupin superfamily)